MRDIDDDDLNIQCDVFDDEKHDDDEELAAMTSAALDISNPDEVFKVVLQKVSQRLPTQHSHWSSQFEILSNVTFETYWRTQTQK